MTISFIFYVFNGTEAYSWQSLEIFWTNHTMDVDVV